MQAENSPHFLPWYNFPLIEFVKSQIEHDMNIFEYGCGFSTLFYAQNGCNVYGIETRQEWIEKVRTLAEMNNIETKINVNLCEKIADFHKAALEYHIKFDIIAVDSIQRLACLEAAKSIYNGGFIILDNSERPNLQNAKNTMEGFKFLEFHGKRPHDEGTSSALVFYKQL